MRQLTKGQKKVLDNYFNSQILSDDERNITGNVFKGGKSFMSVDNLPSEVFQKVEAMNDTEILYQEVDRYLMDKTLAHVYKK